MSPVKLAEGLVCPRCGGSGRVPDERLVGQQMREKRLASWLTLREMARRLALSPAYVSDLELGRRRWTPKILARYQRALP